MSWGVTMIRNKIYSIICDFWARNFCFIQTCSFNFFLIISFTIRLNLLVPIETQLLNMAIAEDQFLKLFEAGPTGNGEMSFKLLM